MTSFALLDKLFVYSLAMFVASAVLLGLSAVAVASPLGGLDAHSLFARTSCSVTGPASCQNTTAQSNLCCFEAPGVSLHLGSIPRLFSYIYLAIGATFANSGV